MKAYNNEAMKEEGHNSELSTGHFSWTRPDPAKRWPDPTRDCQQKVWPDPTRPLQMYYMFQVKTISSGLIYQDRGLEATQRLQISDVSEVHARFNSSRSKLWWLNIFHSARFKQTSVTSQSARRPNVY